MFRPSRKWLLLIFTIILLLLLPPLLQLLGEEYLISLASRILIYALVAVSLDLMLGYGGMVSLGHAAFFGIGAYVVAVFSHHSFDGTPLFSWPFILPGTDAVLLLWPLAILISALLAAMIGVLSLRTSGMHFIMITLAFAQMLFFFFVSLEAYGGDDGLSLFERNRLPGFDLSNDTHFYYLCLALLGAFVLIAYRLVSSRFGMVIRGSRDNEKRMQALGFPTFRYKLACFVIAGAAAGLAGALIANHTEYVSPGLMHWTHSGVILVMVLLGGSGTLFGPILGAATFLILEEVLSIYTEHWMLYLGPALILVVLFARQGIYGMLAGRERNNV
ncbi:MAG: branched-chain amino acid ABC transporter permease [Desulfuromonadales bacterium]|nr:branched-chain amino acid ABC transporter permease [Desulfuromonadales bacterium]